MLYAPLIQLGLQAVGDHLGLGFYRCEDRFLKLVNLAIAFDLSDQPSGFVVVYFVGLRSVYALGSAAA